MRDARCPGGAAHGLVVGGSGMLGGLCDPLSADGRQVTVVGINPLSVDYQQVDGSFAALEEAAAARGPIVLAVCWIRSWLPRSLLAAPAVVAPDGRLFHVVGSQRSVTSAAAIAELQPARRAQLPPCRARGCPRQQWPALAERRRDQRRRLRGRQGGPTVLSHRDGRALTVGP